MPRWIKMLTTAGILLWATPLTARPLCQPTLTVKEASLSPVINRGATWSAAISVDARPCASATGLFALGFVRGAENAPDLKFLEPFIWHAGETKVRVEFWADETVERRIGSQKSAPCLCRE